ncbi:MAG TPA: DJ-1/PfpI family protein [Steroidobacteraceae bacterium]|nr:DJ-1/PfpI family protein [Steroidobacteraceae bacterium]
MSALLPAQAQIAPYQGRFERTRPVVAVLGENYATELIDFVIPYGILAQSGAAEVLAVGTGAGPIRMRPALRIEPQATLVTFDQRFPDGADYVIVPAMMFESRAAQSIVLDWLRAQAAKGATVVSICDGAMVVAQAGLFKGHRATGHWATQSKREHAFPDTQWLENTRYVADGKVISSAGVTAAIPLSLALVEAFAGTDSAARVARELGVSDWSSEHDSQQFHMRASTYALAIRNLLSRKRTIDLQVSAGEDEISLALAADAYSRTFRNRAFTLASTAGAVRTKGGLMLLPDRTEADVKSSRDIVMTLDGFLPGEVLDQTLADITRMYGSSTASFVALQLEYPRPGFPVAQRGINEARRAAR